MNAEIESPFGPATSDSRSGILQQHNVAPTEGAIVAHWIESGPPVVTIVCSTFNHSNYIGDALSGFLKQRTTFPFEIVVRDDASTDGTQQIIREFAQRYPRLIRAVLNERNQRDMGRYPVYERPALIRGEFTALCDGDDFWTDPEKLQLQVDQLRRDPAIVLSTGATILRDLENNTDFATGKVDAEVVYSDLPTEYHHTSTFLFRSYPYIEVIRKYLEPNGLYGDTPAVACILLYGKVAVIPRVVSVYRIHGEGVWSRLDAGARQEEHVRIFAELVRVLPWRRRAIELHRLAESSLALVDAKSGGLTPRSRTRRLKRATQAAVLMINALVVSYRSARLR